jgi:HK97 family phage major capsid protein/HK97 family phage prohead protease
MKFLLNASRSLRLERAEKDGPLTIAISSEAEVNRGWYVEILSHDPGAVVMERASMGLSFLVDHDTKRLAGRVEEIRLEDRKLRGDLRFGSSALAQEIDRDIADGIRPDISVGYRILDYREEKRDGILYLIATRWEPLEVSTVPIPADPMGSGVGRSANATACTNPDCTDPDCQDPECQGECSVDQKCSICASHRSIPTPGIRQESPNPPADPAGTTRGESMPTPEEIAAAQRAAETLKSEARASAVNDTLAVMELATRANLAKEAADMLRGGSEAPAIRSMLLDKIMERGGNPFSSAPVALTEKEQQSYSIARAISAQATGANCFEREVSQELAKKLGREAGGIYVPTYISQTRAQDATVAATAKNLISNEQVTFIELLRNMTVVIQAGATTMPGCVGNIPFARQNAAGGATWTGDNPGGGVGNSDPTTETFTMSPKQLMAKRTYSKQLLAQTAGFADRYVNEDLAQAHGLELDRAALFGTGNTNQPLGVTAMSGIGAVAGGTNGAAPGWSHVVNLETAIAVANALMGNLAYITNNKARGFFKQALIAAAAGSDMIWGKDNTINGYKALASGQVPSNFVKGSSGAVCSAILFGNWRELLIAEWGALDLVTDPYSLADQGLIRVISTQLVDVNARHTQSFAVMLDALCG